MANLAQRGAPSASPAGAEEMRGSESVPGTASEPSDGLLDPEAPFPSFVVTHGVNESFPAVQRSLIDSGFSGSATVAAPRLVKPRFELRQALLQELEYLSVEHGFRLMQDPELRSQLLHCSFFHNWIASFKGYDLKRWGDGDNFLVNDIAHPMQGAVAGWIFLQNSPVGRTEQIGARSQYWISRMKAMAWGAAFEVQWKIGPLSETSIGNAGGWEYVPGCGINRRCLAPGRYPPPTNNTGLSDWIMTPIGGFGWIVMEDALDKYVVSKLAERNRLSGIIARTALEPARNFAALFNGVLPWDKRRDGIRFMHSMPATKPVSLEETTSKLRPRSLGVDFVSLSLPREGNGCPGCRQTYIGIGIPYTRQLSLHSYWDSQVSYFPGDTRGGPTVQGLSGFKFGEQTRRWGIFGKIRPGFLYYRNAWSGGNHPHFTDLTRFALDVGGVLECLPNPRSAVRLDVGTTLVRYLQNYPYPRSSKIENLVSTDYYVTQGNIQITTSYRIRF